MKTGTCHFVSFFDAVNYYKAYGFSRSDVARKKDDGEIKIGRPSASIAKLSIDEYGRYWIED